MDYQKIFVECKPVICHLLGGTSRKRTVPFIFIDIRNPTLVVSSLSALSLASCHSSLHVLFIFFHSQLKTVVRVDCS